MNNQNVNNQKSKIFMTANKTKRALKIEKQSPYPITIDESVTDVEFQVFRQNVKTENRDNLRT